MFEIFIESFLLHRTRLVSLLLLCRPSLNFIDSVLNHSSLNGIHSEDKTIDLFQFFRRVGNDIFEPEEVDWNVTCFSNFEPIAVPLQAHLRASPLVIKPFRVERLLCKLVVECNSMSIGIDEIEA